MLRYVLFLFCTSFAFAAVDPVILPCKDVTPQIKHEKDKIPQYFSLSNSLLRKTGEFYRAVGKPIFLYGRILDINCVPVPNAVISIWQTNAYGEYQYSSESADLPEYDPYFLGSGTATTDNLGRFSFITILPVEKNGQTYINLIIKHEDFEEFHTKIFFRSSKKNIKSTPNSLFAKQKENKSRYEFNIVLEQPSKLLSY